MLEDDQDRAADLARRFREGDEEALRDLLAKCRGDLLARIRRLLPPALDRKVAVSDIFQESCVAAFRRREDFAGRDGQDFRKWLFGIARNKTKDAVRHHERTARRSARREVTRGQRAETAAYPARQPSPSEVAVGAELSRLEREAFVSLPEDYREILRLAREERLSLKDAAARMGRSHEAARKLYGRALLRFRKEFDRLRGESDG